VTFLRRVLLAVLLAAGLTLSAPTTSLAAQPALFTTEQAARQHCPADVVVWLNTQSGVYHLRGQRYYANTKRGAFVCKREADASGTARATRNGQ
jgi:hypothetical protein